jgi:hypothetical protein
MKEMTQHEDIPSNCLYSAALCRTHKYAAYRSFRTYSGSVTTERNARTYALEVSDISLKGPLHPKLNCAV